MATNRKKAAKNAAKTKPRSRKAAKGTSSEENLSLSTNDKSKVEFVPESTDAVAPMPTMASVPTGNLKAAAAGSVFKTFVENVGTVVRKHFRRMSLQEIQQYVKNADTSVSVTQSGTTITLTKGDQMASFEY